MLCLAALSLMGCATSKEPLRTVPHVDLPRYMGDWYVIANIPYFAEKNCFDSIESYALRPDGHIANWFTCRKGSFTAPMKRLVNAVGTVKNTDSNAVWGVRFFKVISVQYLIIDLDPQYQWVVVGHPSRRYGWIMSRAKTIDPQTYQGILERLRAHHYDPSKFQLVPQQATQ